MSLYPPSVGPTKGAGSGLAMKKIEAVIKPFKLDEVKDAGAISNSTFANLTIVSPYRK